MGKLIENLPVRLTDAELASKAFELGRAVMELIQKKQDLKDYVSDEKAKIDEVAASIEELAAVLEQRQEMRAVECYEQFDHENATVEVIRRDTFEIVRVRPMTEQDRQLRLYNQKAVNDEAPTMESYFPRSVEADQIESIETDPPGDILDQVREDPIPPPPIISSEGLKEDEAAYIQEIQKGPRPRTRRPGSMRDQCAWMISVKGSKKGPTQCLQPALLDSQFCEWHDNKSKKHEVKTMADDINIEVNPDDEKEKDPIERERKIIDREEREKTEREKRDRKDRGKEETEEPDTSGGSTSES